MNRQAHARRIAPLLAAFCATLALTALAFHLVRPRTDITGFLPEGRTEAARFMLDELRHGAASGLVMIGVENAPVPTLAGLARDIAGALRADQEFQLVAGGDAGFGEAEADFLFAHRLLLSPATTAEAFAAPALERDLRTLLAGLGSSAAPLVARYGLADPIGALPALARAWMPDARVRAIDGAWFAAGRDRALLIARLRAEGLDATAETRALAAIRAAFKRARARGGVGAAGAELLLAGPAAIAERAARDIRADVERMSILSGLLVSALLWWRFRSLTVLAAVAVPVLLSVDAALLAVRWGFGEVQGAAIGFGMTMLGVTADYPVLLIGHRKPGEPQRATLRRIGPTLALAVLAAALGLAGMAGCGFPGLAQIGAFSVAGLLSAALVSCALLPPLVAAADLAPAPMDAAQSARLLRIESWRRWRWLAWGPVVASAALLALHPPRWERDLAALSPVAAADGALDREMRGELGAPGLDKVLVVRGPDAETVLRREEAMTASPALAGAMAASSHAARLLPSVRAQAARRAALPSAPALHAALAAAMMGTPFRAEAFEPFEAAAAAARLAPPLRPEDPFPPALHARLAALLSHRGAPDRWYGAVVAGNGADAATLAASAGPDSFVVDMREEAARLAGTAMDRAWLWLALGGGLTLAAVAAGLRDRRRIARALAPVGSALLLAVALLDLLGARFSVAHVVALQFVAGLGLDYALFFARRRLDIAERARTLRTLLTCNAMTLLTFGALACCRTALLRQIGLTVALGAFCAMALAFLAAGEAADADKTRETRETRDAAGYGGHTP